MQGTAASADRTAAAYQRFVLNLTIERAERSPVFTTNAAPYGTLI
jgi:hypothetical protein